MNATEINAYIAKRGIEGTAFHKIADAAQANGWTVKIRSDEWSYGWMELDRRSKRTTVFFDTTGRVSSASRRTGASCNTRNFTGVGKAAQIIAHLAN